MAHYFVDSNGRIIKTKKKTKYDVDSKGNLTEDFAPIRTTVSSTDFAPVKEEDEKKLDFFQKGSKIGDQKGFWNRVLDVPQAILGTAGDAGLGVLKGAGSLVEGIGDLGLYGVAGVADLVGADKISDKTKKFAQKNTVQDITKGADDYLNQYSVLGKTSDAITQGVGQVGTIILTGGIGTAGGLGIAGTTALTTGVMGVSSAGSGMSEAYQGGATDEEALKYGISKGVIDAGSELIFGGLGKAVGAVGLSKGISSLDDVFAQKLSSKISNQVAKNVVEFGVKASGEGFEEIVAGVGSAVAKKLTYMDEEELSKIVEDENLLEQFVVGTVTSGMIQSGYIPGTAQGSLKEANATGRDFITGYTQNEQAVIDKVVEQRVAEQETDERKLTKKEIGEIESEVKTAFERGEIDIDTIESVIGGEMYTQYNDLLEESKEYEQLYKTKDRDLSEEQRDRLAELKKKNEAKPYEAELSSLRERLTQEVNTKTQNDTFIRESFNEKARKGKAFEADLTKYNEKERETIQKAIDSGILNDTRKTHDFVDLIARVTAKTGATFDFADNQKIKESGFAIEGKTVNGYVDVKTGNVVLNINSSKALNTVVGHEITHILEGTEFYDQLQTVITEYAKIKGDYDGRLDAITKLYEGQFEGTAEEIQAKINKELTADLVGDYLFTDSDFINNLSATKPNVFKRIYDEIKYLYKVATAGSQEARELEKVKNAFAKAYNEARAGVKDSSEVQATEGKVDIEPERISEKEMDSQYSLSHNPEIAKGQSDYILEHKTNISAEELAEAQRVTNAMVDVMMKYSSILPEDKIGKVLTKNGSYDRSVENTTICVRTLAYNEFVDKVQEEIGRPLTQMESFLVSQKLYDIATEPQCMYCYVSLDRKAFNDMLLRYMHDRDSVIDKYKKSDKTDEAVRQLYEEFLNGRKDTKPMKQRFDKWIKDFDSGVQLLSLADIATEERQNEIKANGGELATQLADARKYAQSASWSKIQKNYVAYRDEILKLGDRVVKNLNEHYGLRWYSFSDYSPAFIVENMQQITDASIRGLKGLSYTKDTDFAKVFAPSGMNINISVFVNIDENGNFYIDEKQSANFEEAKKLREQYPNVGIVATVTNDEALRWAGSQEWSDVIIPFHIVRTGTDVAEYYKWLNYTSESADTIKDSNIWEAYLDSLNLKSENARKKVSKNIYPNEHKNDKTTYLTLCENRGLTPRFARFAGEDWYMKLVNETRLSAEQSAPLKPVYDLESAQASFQKFIEKGGYEGGWYKDGVDVDAEAKVVASDVLAGKKANEVEYGRQDNFDPELLIGNRKSNRTHGKYSLSDASDIAPTGKYEVYGKGIALEQSTISEVESVAPVAQTEVVQGTDEPEEAIAPMQSTDEVLYSLEEEQKEKVAEIDKTVNEEEAIENTPLPNGKKDYDTRMSNYKTALEGYNTAKDTIVSAYNETINKKTAEYNALKRKDTKKAGNLLSQIETLKLRKSENVTSLDSKIARVEKIIDNMVNNETKIRDDEKWERKKQRINDRFENDKKQLREEYDKKQAEALEELKDRNSFISKKAFELYNELKNLKKGVRASDELGYLLDFGYPWSELKTALLNTRAKPDRVVNQNSGIESVVREAIGREHDSRLEDASYSIEEEYRNELKELESERDTALKSLEESRTGIKRTDYHRSIVDKIKNAFSSKGFDFDKVLETAKDKGTFSSVDNTPQRFIEKSLGYKEGQILNDLTINKVAQNETEGIKWLNSFTDKKAGLLAKISKEYGIKPRSKESASAQMYAEGFWVDDNGNFIKYGDAELAKDYPDVKVQENIKKLAKDERIRKIYDETLAMINESRKRNLYPEIPRRNNYFLHFREMDDTFSRLGIPFNPNDIRLKDLPTDINGMTADLKPGQPYFASAKQRLGYKTTYDLVGGVERYLNSAKNQIYHIDDIQTLRALRNYIADTFGQAKGLGNLDSMTEEEAMARIEEVFNSHLSTFAKFLNEEANILAGKTSLTDRGLEGVIGRRGIQFLDTVNRQVGSNMVGANVSSALTNTVSIVQAIAKSSKRDAVKAFAQTVSNKLGSISGKTDGFADNNPLLIRRRGIEKLTRTPWESIVDKGYLLASAVDSISSEFVARTKFNELTRKGMDEQQAHIEADKWASRLLGDRSLGQQPQLYNSKMLGLVTKFQLEVRNQLDSQFYDTVQEVKYDNEVIKDALERNLKTSAKVASTFFQLAVLQHLFGQAFESVAGYNPAFDIVEVLMQVFGFDDDEESEDTVLDNLEQGFLTLLDDLPYTSTLTGGRIPISSALPIEQFVTGKDDYGNEKSRWETLKETAPYYIMPTGYGQIKKTKQGLEMFSDEHPVAGSYTNSGNLRFPVEDTTANRVKSAIFGQYASDNARDYFDNERNPLKENQIAEFAELDIPIKDYWEYREGLSEQDTIDKKFDYVAGLDLPVEKKNIMINNIVDRKEEVDLTNYDDFADYEEFDFATKNAEKYGFLQSINVSYKEYNQSEGSKDAYNWAFENQDKYSLAKVVGGDVVTYRRYASEIGKIVADKDENGKTINGSRKDKVVEYINGLNADYGAKIILLKTEYPSDDTYNYDIIDYLNNNSDISYEEEVEILKALGFTVDANGTISW